MNTRSGKKKKAIKLMKILLAESLAKKKVVPVVPAKIGNTSQSSAARYWCFTLNNYTKQDISGIISSSSSRIWRFVFQEETGEEDEENYGTPHLQGFIDYGLGNKRRPMNEFAKLLGHNRTHWEKTRNVQKSIKYCQKERSRTGQTFRRRIEPTYKITIVLYKWQQEILKICESDPDDRTIHYIIGSDGMEGKTTFGKWLYMNMDRVVVLSGKASDMKNAIIDYQKKREELPKTIVINIPRSVNQTYISWTGIEEIKDMFFYSGKYEGGMICGKSPHVFIFANEPPDLAKISPDRWKIIDINPSTGDTADGFPAEPGKEGGEEEDLL